MELRLLERRWHGVGLGVVCEVAVLDLRLLWVEENFFSGPCDADIGLRPWLVRGMLVADSDVRSSAKPLSVRVTYPWLSTPRVTSLLPLLPSVQLCGEVGGLIFPRY